MKRRWIVLPLAAALLIGGALLLEHLFRPRIVVSATMPDGTEICIHQFFTWTTEPFYTSVFSKKNGGSWRWFYYDHQDNPWLSGRIDLDMTNNVAVIFRGQTAVGAYSWTNDTFIHYRRGTTDSSESATWSPEQSDIKLYQ